ncbi:MAG: hypothetical protein ACH346_04705 [Chthoniobacterales bacterium]
MTEHTDTTLSQNILNPILETGLEGLPEAISLLINHACLATIIITHQRQLETDC